jgi:cell division protein FtsI/penicillin-binding protein 2
LRFLRRNIVAALLIALLVPFAPAWTAKSARGHKSIGTSKGKKKRRGRWVVPTFADSTASDVVENDDPWMRRIAVQALGPWNGSVVVVDPETGRILTVVNQRLAFDSGFQPCSTVKLAVAYAALKEGVVTEETMIRVGRRLRMNLTEAMAESNNRYFEFLGRQLGFEKFARYARLLGFGELSGYQLEQERPGTFPAVAPGNGGVARMSSFGEGIRVTPLQLAALVSAFANGGNMYYLQYAAPENGANGQGSFEPRLKRRIEVADLMPAVRPGLLGAVLYGTARDSFVPEAQILGKTGTCSAEGARLGWFASYSERPRKLVVVVLLRGGSRSVMGPKAAEIAGQIYRELQSQNYFASTVSGTDSSGTSASPFSPQFSPPD